MVELKKMLLYKESYVTSQILEEELQNEHTPSRSETNCQRVVDRIVRGPLCVNQKCMVGQNLMSDIELIEAYQEGDANTVLNRMNMTKLRGSVRYLRALLEKPVGDLQKLVARQNLVKKLAGISEQIEPLFDTLVRDEKDVLWLYEERDAELVHLYDMVYFKNILLRPLNTRGEVLTIHNTYRILGSPLVGILTPIVYFIVPFLVVKYKLGLDIGFATYLRMSMSSMTMSLGFGNSVNTVRYISYLFSMVFYFQGIFNSIELSKTVYQMSKLLTNKIQGVIRYIQAAKKLNDIVFEVKEFAELFNTADTPLRADIDMFTDVDTYNSFSIFSNYGRSLRVYKYLEKDAYLPLLNRTYMIDTVMSIHRAKMEHGLSFPDYTDIAQSGVELSIRGMWHPCLNRATAVRNDIVLGQPNNALLTGPNAGGKSTLLKSILICVVLSQTLGVANAEHISFTPFAFINSQINVPDCKGKESLFEAEMYRSKSNLDVLRDLGGQPSLIVMDEIFNSTNPVEGIAGAYAIAKNLASFPSNISIISTHYLYLTKLAKDVPHAFVNYKMNVRMDTEGNLISYPYKLMKGVSRQYVALELLKKNGFDLTIIQDALNIKRRLITKTTNDKQ